MLLDYIQAAMRKATYKLLAADEGFYGENPDCPGVWANAPTLEACREELQSVLEDWILIRTRMQMPLPTIDGLDLNPQPLEETEVA